MLCRRGMQTELDEDVRLLDSVYRWSLTTAETDAQRLRQKNAIEQSEREAAEAARLAKQRRSGG